MKTEGIKSPKGMYDIVEPASFAWRNVEAKIKQHFENFGFSEIRTPIVEYTSLFTRGVGGETDIVKKEMYTFLDRNNESLTLRPEGTASVVRALLEQNLLNQDPIQKLYYFGPMFRYERPQKGRSRQFYQYGFEVFGVAEPRQDAELIFMLYDLYEKLGLKDLCVKISSLGCSECRPSFLKNLVEKLSLEKAKLSAESQERLIKNPLRILDSKNPEDKKIVQTMPVMLDHLCEACQKHFESVQKDLKNLKVNYILDKTLVRGLDYYNRTVFEISSQSLGAQDAVGGGGRYDGLVQDLGGPATPAVGYAGGMERLILLLGENFESYRPELTAFFVTPDEKGRDKSFLLASELRQQGLRVEMDHTGRSMKSQMKRADRLKALWTIIIGGQEVDKGLAVVRNMKSKEQIEIPFEKIAEKIQEKSL
jgi:histidyl-tRNA synthetase